MSAPSTSMLAALCMAAAPLQAHEFWIEPADYAVPAGAAVEARFVNGEGFAGSTLSYIPDQSARFDMVAGGRVTPVPARMGANPAFAVADLPDGLLTILHETDNMTLTWSGWDRFAAFAAHKALGDVAAMHAARGLPRDAVRESYRRFAKALVAVGDGTGQDAAHGLLAEFVAGANPYTDDMADGLPVQVLYRGAPRAGAQVEMFARAPDGAVAVTIHLADADGRALLPVQPGHAYLLDSVVLEPLEPASDGDPVWQTNWAALTFAVPGA